MSSRSQPIAALHGAVGHTEPSEDQGLTRFVICVHEAIRIALIAAPIIIFARIVWK